MRPHDNSDVTNDDIYAMLAGELTPSDIHRRRAEADSERQQAIVRDELIAFYDVLNTSHLLAQYRDVQRASWYSYDHGPRTFPMERLEVKNGICKKFVSRTAIIPFQQTVLDAIKTILDTREHIPRGKKARQLKAKLRKGQGKSKNR